MAQLKPDSSGQPVPQTAAGGRCSKQAPAAWLASSPASRAEARQGSAFSSLVSLCLEQQGRSEGQPLTARSERQKVSRVQAATSRAPGFGATQVSCPFRVLCCVPAGPSAAQGKPTLQPKVSPFLAPFCALQACRHSSNGPTALNARACTCIPRCPDFRPSWPIVYAL